MTTVARAEGLRLATYDVELTRRGPGLLLQDIARGRDPGIAAGVTAIAAARPDVLLLTGFDWDHGQEALAAYAARLSAAGVEYPYRYAPRPNAGRPSGLDLDGDGRRGGPGDALGYGAFTGRGGMALLSRLPLDLAKARDFTGTLWRDVPGAQIEAAKLREGAAAVLPLFGVGAWAVPVMLPGGGRLEVVGFAAAAPVFDGPEDRNGRRNADQIGFLRALIGGRLSRPFVLLGDANVDPERGEGRQDAIRGLLGDPALQDALPGAPTVLWPKVGALRVDYVLPSAGLRVTGAGVAPATDGGSRHRLVWVEVALR